MKLINKYYLKIQDAEDDLRKMHYILDEFGNVSVADYYDISGIEFYGTEHMKETMKYGWTDLKDAHVYLYRGSYHIKFPKIKNIKGINSQDLDHSKTKTVFRTGYIYQIGFINENNKIDETELDIHDLPWDIPDEIESNRNVELINLILSLKEEMGIKEIKYIKQVGCIIERVEI